MMVAAQAGKVKTNQEEGLGSDTGGTNQATGVLITGAVKMCEEGKKLHKLKQEVISEFLLKCLTVIIGAS